MCIAQNAAAHAADAAGHRVEPDAAALALGRDGGLSQKPHVRNLVDWPRRCTGHAQAGPLRGEPGPAAMHPAAVA